MEMALYQCKITLVTLIEPNFLSKTRQRRTDGVGPWPTLLYVIITINFCGGVFLKSFVVSLQNEIRDMAHIPP